MVAWLRRGVVTDAVVDWLAEHAAGMRHGPWGAKKGNGQRRWYASCSERQATWLECKFAAAVRLYALCSVGRVPWSASRGRRVGRLGACPCHCCKRWWTVVFITAETDGWSAHRRRKTAEIRADVARGIQQSRGAYDRARSSSGADRSKNTVAAGHCRFQRTDRTSTPGTCRVRGVRNTHAVLVKFTDAETIWWCDR
jgi:hypothetical protein